MRAFVFCTVVLVIAALGCDEPGPRSKPSEVARAWASIAAPVQGVVCDRDQPGGYGAHCTIVFVNGGVVHATCSGFGGTHCHPGTEL